MQARHALFLSTLFLSAAALAGEPPAPPAAADAPFRHPTPAQVVQHIDQHADLRLSDAQKQQMQAALEDEHARIRAIREENKARMAKILTPEQQARLDQRREELRQRHAERMQARAEALKAGVAVPVPAPAAPQ